MDTQALSPQRDEDRERGAALIMAIFFVLMLTGFSYLVLNSYQAQSSTTMFKVRHSRLFAEADTALAKGKLILISNPTKAEYTGSAGNPYAFPNLENVDNARVTVELIGANASPYVYRLISDATDPANGQRRSVEMILSLEENRVPANAPGMGAIVANGNLQVTGGIEIDGNDHTPAGSPRVDASARHVPGVVTTGTVSQDGSSKIGGSGDPISTAPTQGTGIDNGTSQWDQESTLPGNDASHDSDGVDNDGDGVIDEDGFPLTAGAVFGIKGDNPTDLSDDNDSLKAQATSDGTFFTSYSSYNTWRQGATPVEQGGKVIYIEIANGDSISNFKLPYNSPTTGAKPSILIVAGTNPAIHDTEIGPVQATGSGSDKHFQGLVIADTFKNINGSGKLTGSMLAFNPADSVHLGNGSFEVLFSSEVLGDLPGINQAPVPWTPEILNWREIENR